QIRPMTPADIDVVLAVERECYAQPWTAEFFAQELNSPFASVELLLAGEELAGYLCCWFLEGELHILNLATAPAFRRRGVADTLLRRALGIAREHNVEKAFLEVRASNEGAISLYQRFGFQSVFCRPDYYPDGEDAFVMELAL
ncbi:MAG: ribosomal protein S18-alanine N-acetyltransferase, partial [Desulfuromonadales bacterium]